MPNYNPFAKWNTPRALPSREWNRGHEKVDSMFCWEDFNRDTKAAYPVAWFLRCTLPAFIRTWFIWPVRHPVAEAWYWLRTHTVNRYHIVNLKNPRNGYKWGWIDRDQAILFACFNIFQDFCEKEKGLDSLKFQAECDWKEWGEGAAEMRATKYAEYQEAKSLYDWWTGGRAAEHAEVDALYDKLDRNVIVDQPSWDSWNARYVALPARDDEMLLRLMKIRNTLWT